ncbi:MAG: 16S rRNA (guanine(966)-N(2))-methyltransferase RsmD [Oscillospiraceae bacterium]|nr:16S rRNA (guanine(966)-N(2))-methyltransferase RsmD [Oscillospiraceae bacterium]
MRVISGTAGGRRLKDTPGYTIRPTSGMVKESIFNIVQFDIEGRSILDLFAGTGQLGIEALSRGAKSATFIDTSPDAIKLIWDNLKLCGLTENASVHTADALSYLKKDETFDLIFVDPPYNTNLVEKALARIIEFDKVNTNGIIICEIKAGHALPAVSPPYRLHREYKYGRIMLLRYERE